MDGNLNMNQYLGSLNLNENLLAKDSLLAGTNQISSYEFESNNDRASVTQTQLSADAIGTSNIADEAVTTTKIAGSAVINTKLASSSVDGRVIASGAVGSTEIAASQIHGSHIVNFNNAAGTGAYGGGTFGALRADTSISANGTVGISAIATIVDRNSGVGTTTHTLTFRYGLLTAYGTA